MNKTLDSIRDAVRSVMRAIARGLNRVSGGHLSPNLVTLVGLLAHAPIAYLIAYGKSELAALLLVIFGLFDTLDGELARLQKRASSAGMVLDASTDRMKEVMLYVGAAYFFIHNQQLELAVWAVAACGGSLLVSYVKAKGETAIADSSLNANQKNRVFQDGLMRFELRMFALVVGLLTNHLDYAIITIAVLAVYTALQRLYLVTRTIENVKD